MGFRNIMTCILPFKVLRFALAAACLVATSCAAQQSNVGQQSSGAQQSSVGRGAPDPLQVDVIVGSEGKGMFTGAGVPPDNMPIFAAKTAPHRRESNRCRPTSSRAKTSTRTAASGPTIVTTVATLLSASSRSGAPMRFRSSATIRRERQPGVSATAIIHARRSSVRTPFRRRKITTPRCSKKFGTAAARLSTRRRRFPTGAAAICDSVQKPLPGSTARSFRSRPI